MYGRIDFTKFDTTPGADNAFSPPAGWQGDENEYVVLMRDRYTNGGPGYRQHFFIAGWDLLKERPVLFVGPFSQKAKEIAEMVVSRKKLLAA